MIKRYGSRIVAILIFFGSPWLTGCSLTTSYQTLMEINQEKKIRDVSSAINKMNQTDDSLPVSRDMYRRRLSITFNQEEFQVNKKHQQIINLFFKSLPDHQQLNIIIISVAPSSAGEPFETLKDSWARLQSLKKMLTQYSQEIELIYQPDLDIDSATIHVVGGSTTGGKDVQ